MDELKELMDAFWKINPEWKLYSGDKDYTKAKECAIVAINFSYNTMMDIVIEEQLGGSKTLIVDKVKEFNKLLDEIEKL